MAEYVSREAAIEAAKHAWAKGLEPSQYIEELPSADVAPVVHGRWRALRKYDARRTYRCSVCGRTIRLSLAIDINEYAPYCHCGAMMEGNAENG